MATSTSSTPTLRISVLGDADTGKSNLITTYTSNYFTGAYIPTIEETYHKKVSLTHNGEPSTLQLSISDLGGSEVHDRLRQLILGVQGPTDVFILCFRLGDAVSLGSVVTRWKDIADHAGKGVPVVVVGLISDEAPDVTESSVVAEMMGASAYLECSALEKKGVKEVFEEVVRVGLVKRDEKLLRESVNKWQKKGKGRN